MKQEGRMPVYAIHFRGNHALGAADDYFVAGPFPDVDAAVKWSESPMFNAEGNPCFFVKDMVSEIFSGPPILRGQDGGPSSGEPGVYVFTLTETWFQFIGPFETEGAAIRHVMGGQGDGVISTDWNTVMMTAAMLTERPRLYAPEDAGLVPPPTNRLEAAAAEAGPAGDRSFPPERVAAVLSARDRIIQVMAPLTGLEPALALQYATASLVSHLSETSGQPVDRCLEAFSVMVMRTLASPDGLVVSLGREAAHG